MPRPMPIKTRNVSFSTLDDVWFTVHQRPVNNVKISQPVCNRSVHRLVNSTHMVAKTLKATLTTHAGRIETADSSGVCK